LIIAVEAKTLSLAIGLGVGIGLAVIILIVVIIVVSLLAKRRQQRRFTYPTMLQLKGQFFARGLSHLCPKSISTAPEKNLLIYNLTK